MRLFDEGGKPRIRTTEYARDVGAHHLGTAPRAPASVGQRTQEVCDPHRGHPETSRAQPHGFSHVLDPFVERLGHRDENLPLGSLHAKGRSVDITCQTHVLVRLDELHAETRHGVEKVRKARRVTCHPTVQRFEGRATQDRVVGTVWK